MAAMAGAFWVGWRYQRARIDAATRKEVDRLRGVVKHINETTAGLDDDELDQFIYGPTDRVQRPPRD